MKKNKNILITTSLKQTWGKNKLFFLGHWCQNRGNFKNLKRNSYKISKYNWDDRKKFLEDYKYLNKLYSKVLNNLSIYLNNVHNVNYSLRYWKILISPWLITFLQISFERYTNLSFFLKNQKYKNFETIILKIKPEKILPNTYEEFSRLILSDTWNHYLYSRLIEYKKFNFKINKNYKKFNNEEKFEEYIENKKSKHNILYNFTVNFIESLFSKSKLLFSESYLGYKYDIKLAFKYFNFPRFSVGTSNTPKNKNAFLRNKKINIKTMNVFEEFIKDHLIEFMPKSFLENFDTIGKQSKNMFWPKSPKIIFTSHFMTKTLQSRYTADCIETQNSKLILGQHGGVYGQYLFSSMENYELDICDKYLSWGWTYKNNKKIIPFGMIKDLKEIEYNNKNSNLLMILRSQPRYTHRLNSYSGTNQIRKYYLENVNLCKKLDKNIVKNNLIIRLHSRKFGWDEDKFFKKKFESIKIDLGYKKIKELFSSAKLVLHTYVGTGYLETLYQNIPTVIYANLNDCLLNKKTLDSLKVLKKAKIFHNDYKSAAKFINSNWNNINEWWNSDICKKARKKYCSYYAMDNRHKIASLNNIIKSI
jgi:putative transferase (TIGR04331 family)